MSRLRKYLIAGLLVWLPLAATVLIIKLIVDLLDSTLLLLPPEWRPETLLGFTVPGFGVVLSFAVLLLTGMLVANFLGRRVVALWEFVLRRIPLVRTVYLSVKQVAETVFSSGGESFKKVLLIEYPRKGIWSFAFLTGAGLEEVEARTGARTVTVFVPTTPNPTSGFVLVLPREDAIELDMSVEDALRLIMSVGVVAPAWRPGGAAETSGGPPVAKRAPSP